MRELKSETEASEISVAVLFTKKSRGVSEAIVIDK
jgi:hypothetical protein